MSPEKIAAIVVVVLTILAIIILVMRRLPRRLKQQKFVSEWRKLQMLCKDKSTWRDAVIGADKLLDKALKQRKFKGKSPGERLVAAQRKFSKNDQVWDAHKLYKKLITHEDAQPKEEETKQALTSFRQALRDIGALPNEQ